MFYNLYECKFFILKCLDGVKMFIFEIKDDVVFLNGKRYFLFIIKEYVLLELNFVFEGISKLLGSWVLNLCNIFFFFLG